MIFPKQLLQESLEIKYKKQFHDIHPYQTAYAEGDKTPFEQYIQNYNTFFDLKSNELKAKKQAARVAAIEQCFNKVDLNVYPNSGKVDACIKQKEAEHLGKAYDKRNLYFGNIIEHLNDSLKSCTTKDFKCVEAALERFIWDGYKAKYYFKEKFNAV